MTQTFTVSSYQLPESERFYFYQHAMVIAYQPGKVGTGQRVHWIDDQGHALCGATRNSTGLRNRASLGVVADDLTVDCARCQNSMESREMDPADLELTGMLPELEQQASTPRQAVYHMKNRESVESFGYFIIKQNTNGSNWFEVVPVDRRGQERNPLTIEAHGLMGAKWVIARWLRENGWVDDFLNPVKVLRKKIGEIHNLGMAIARKASTIASKEGRALYNLAYGIDQLAAAGASDWHVTYWLEKAEHGIDLVKNAAREMAYPLAGTAMHHNRKIHERYEKHYDNELFCAFGDTISGLLTDATYDHLMNLLIDAAMEKCGDSFGHLGAQTRFFKMLRDAFRDRHAEISFNEAIDRAVTFLAEF